MSLIFSLSFFYVMLLLPRSGSSTFRLENGCTCPGQVVVYECNMGNNGIATVWRGSAFDCPENGNTIILLHNDFSNGMAHGDCNNGDIIAQGVSSSGDVLTSRLSVMVTSSLDGKRVECAVDNGSMTTIVHNSTIQLTTDPIHPPVVEEPSISNREKSVTFSWDPPATNCSELTYRLTTSNCGNCTDTYNTDVQQTSIVCTDLTCAGRECRFSVRTVVCGYIVGDASQPKNVSLSQGGESEDCTKSTNDTAIVAGILSAIIAILVLTVIIMLAISIVLYNRSKKKQVYDANAVNRKKTTKIKGDNESTSKSVDGEFSLNTMNTLSGEIGQELSLHHNEYLIDESHPKEDAKESWLQYFKRKIFSSE